MQSLHPVPSRTVQRTLRGSLPAPYAFTEAQVRREIRCFPFHSSPGPDGLRPSHIKVLPHAPGGAEPTRSALAELTTFVNKMANAELPISLSPHVAGGLLLGIPKPQSSSLRPIAIGTVLPRLLCRLLMAAVLNDRAIDIRSYFLPHQLAVGMKGASEAIVHATRAAIHGIREADIVVLLIDAKNAFNAIERAEILEQVIQKTPGIARWVHHAYGAPLVLLFGTYSIQSLTETQQGDPLSMLLFALALQPLLQMLSAAFPYLKFKIFYADDGTIIVRAEDGLSVLEFLRVQGAKCGFHVNVAKTKIWCPRPLNTQMFQTDIFRYHVSQKPSVTLLSAPLGDTEACTQGVLRRTQMVELLWHRLPHPQTAYHILKVCASACRMFYLLCCTATHITSTASSWFDAGMRRAFEDIYRPLTDSAWKFASLPIRSGGLGLLGTTQMCHAAYAASIMNNAALIRDLLHPYTIDLHCMVSSALSHLHEPYELPLSLLPSALIQRANPTQVPDNLQAEFANVINKHMVIRSLSPYSDPSETAARTRVRLRSVVTLNASRVVTALPQSLKGTRVEPEVWLTILDKRLGNPIFSGETTCSRCARNGHTNVLDIHGHHASICCAQEGTISRHNDLRDKLFSLLAFPMYGLRIYREWVFPQDMHLPHESRRRMDLVVDDTSFALKPQAYDITFITPHARNNVFHSLVAAFSAAERRKRNEYQQLCHELDMDLHTIVFDIYGAVSRNAEKALQSAANFVAKKRGTDPTDERNNMLTRLAIWVNVETAVAINRRMLDDWSPS